MGLPGTAKQLLNSLLRPLNARIESLTAESAETKRLAGLEQAGHFSRAIFPVPAQFSRSDPTAVFRMIAQSEGRFAEFAATPPGSDGFSLQNEYYTTPDAEVLYAMVLLYRPRQIVEIGSGNSTLLFRRAITDAGLQTRITSIDPNPRRSVIQHADASVRERVETLRTLELFSGLDANDILFIDSSHEIKTGNDVLFLFLNVIPALAPGVLIHIHDIFLPYEYPRSWVVGHRWGWTEQYLVQAMLTGSTRLEVLWAGHYLQRTLPDFASRFRFWRSWDARSLWLKTTRESA